MILIALFAFLLPNVCFTIYHTDKFLLNLEKSERSNYINIFQFSDFYESNSIIKNLLSPKLILNNKNKVNYLNHKRFSEIISVNPNYNKQFISLLFMNDTKNIKFVMNFVNAMLDLNTYNIIVIISNNIVKDFSKMLLYFFDFYYLNVVYLSIPYFEKYQKLFFYENFANSSMLTINKGSYFKKETVSNVKQAPIRVICKKNLPYAWCLKNGDKLLTAGRIFNLIKYFVQYINGTMDLIIKGYDFDLLKEDLNLYDFWTEMNLPSVKEMNQNYAYFSNIILHPLEIVHLFVVVPKSQFIDPSHYVLRPFTLQVWILCVVYLIYGTSILSITFLIIQKKPSFWYTFDQLLRALMAQSFSAALTGIPISAFYFLAMFMGFAVTTWYSAVLESVLTTFLRQPQIRTLEDIRKFNISIIGFQDYNNTSSNFELIQDIYSFVSFNDFLKHSRTKEVYGYVIYSEMLKNEFLLSEFHILEDFVLESSALSLDLKYGSIYKHRLNRYIDLVLDTGLYNYWISNCEYELFLMGVKNDRIIYEKKILRILDLTYFLYPFVILGCGLILSYITLVFEIYWKTFIEAHKFPTLNLLKLHFTKVCVCKKL